MSYQYGMKGAPAVGGGLGGLPSRKTLADWAPTETKTILHGTAKSTYNASLDRVYAVEGTILFCISLDGDVIWSVDLGASGYSMEYQSCTGGIKVSNSSTVASFDAYGNLKWQTTLTGVGTIQAIQGDFADNTYVASFTSGTNSWITKLSPTGAVLWSYSFGALTNPNLTGAHVTSSGDVWVSLYSTVTNTVADAYKVSAISGGTIPRLRLSYSGVNVRSGSVAVDGSGNIFFPAGRSSNFCLYVFNSAYTSVASVYRSMTTPTGTMNPMVSIDPGSNSIHCVGSVDPNGGLTSAPYIATYSFTAPSTLSLVSTIYGNQGASSDNSLAFDKQPFFDMKGKLWLSGVYNLLRIGAPVSGASYKNLNGGAATLTFLTDSSGVGSAFTSAYTAVSSAVASPGSSAGTLSPVLRYGSSMIGKMSSDASGGVSVLVANA